MDKIKELKYRKLILLNTNYMEQADELADVCAILNRGVLDGQDSPESLKRRHARGGLHGLSY